MILRSKTEDLIQTRELTEKQRRNTELNKSEMKAGKLRLKSKPQRLVFEMTNSCNLNCVMCGRNAANFKNTFFKPEWLSLFDGITDYVEEVTLMGWGEPTMHPQLPEFLKWADERGLRKYLCTNGMKLGELMPTIFDYNTDVIAISLDAANPKDNESIRRGANFDKIIGNLKDLVAEKKRRGSRLPYMNFITTLMKRNLHEFPEVVKLAGELGLDEAKAVYLTIFDKAMTEDSLYNHTDEVRAVFNEALNVAAEYGVRIKLPHLRGEDEAGDAYHKTCFTGWRDFFLGSDGYIRSCMSTSIKFFPIDKYKSFDEIWNSDAYVSFREEVNDKEKMSVSCRNCYQSSFANWNNGSAFFQIGTDFSPDWVD